VYDVHKEVLGSSEQGQAQAEKLTLVLCWPYVTT
jgi:hypothetical protein